MQSVTAYHAAFPNSNPNSITPVCAAFDLIESNQGQKPVAATNAATNISTNSATLNGAANPNGEATNMWFEWGFTSSNLTNTTASHSVGSGQDAVNYSTSISGLAGNSTYYYRTVAENSYGTAYGNVVSFTTTNNTPNGFAPTATTLSASGIDYTSATLRGRVNPNNSQTNYRFEWGTSQSSLSRTSPWFSAGSDSGDVNVSAGIITLNSNTTYYYRVTATNSYGTAYGNILSFTTSNEGGSTGDRPDVETLNARSIRENSATLACDVTPNDSDTDVWFEWGTSRSNLNNDTANKRVYGSYGTTRVTKRITGLDTDERYYYRCVADNSYGTTRGDIESFRTRTTSVNGDRPSVRLYSASPVTTTASLLKGEINPNDSNTDAWFEWGTTTSLGHRTRVTNMGSGTSYRNISVSITGLTPNTLYFYRLSAENNEGITQSPILSFVTRNGTIIIPRPPTIIERVVRVFVTEEKEKAVLLTLNADKRRVGRDKEIDYIITYENRTDENLRNAVLTVEIPRELRFIDSSPRADSERRDTVTFNIGTIRAGEKDSVEVSTELRSGVSDNDDIEFTATLKYTDKTKTKNIVTVIDVSRFSGKTGNAFTALFIGSLKDFFTNPFFWLLFIILLIFLAYRYIYILGKNKYGDNDNAVYGAPVDTFPQEPVQQRLDE